MSIALVLILTAAPFADLAGIDRQVSAFTGTGIGMEGGAALPVDRRLRLRSCAAPLLLSWRTERRESVVVRCPDAGGWRLFVPVKGMASGGAGGLAATPVINRGDGVTIAVGGPGFSVSQSGEALEAGAVGAWIRVRGLAAKSAAMRGRIVSPGVVEVPLP